MAELNPQIGASDVSYIESKLPIEPMNPAVKVLWADALDSGEFQQGDEVLARGRRVVDGTDRVQYCCLGVLCELAVRAGVIPAGVPVSDPHSMGNTYRIVYGAAGASIVLPQEVIEWAGLNMASPRVIVPADNPTARIDPLLIAKPEGVPLEVLNDNHHPFSAIANLIRASL